MAFVAGFEHDVFISYAHVDNLPLREGEQGWVSQFHRELQVALAARLGRTEAFTIWRDAKLGGNDAFDEAIARRLGGSALLVTIVSPSYCASAYCARELEAFLAAADPALAAPLAERRRVLKIELRRVDDEPAALRELTGRRFYRVDPATEAEEPFRRTLEADPDQQYWMALRDVAASIEQTLKALRQAAARPAGTAAAATAPIARRQSDPDAITAVTAPPPRRRAPPEPAGAVYLAEVADDLEETREGVRRSLEQHGIEVLPASPLPREAGALRTRVEADLARARFSVHLVGTLYGKRPAGDERSIPQLQYDIAGPGARRDQTGATRIAWIPRDVTASTIQSDPLRAWVEALESQPQGHGPVELMRVGIEELKEMLLRRLAPPRAHRPAPAAGGLVYISHQPEDESEAVRLRDLLRGADQDVILPPRTGDPETLARHHAVNLRNCDGLMILYARASVLWVREQAISARQLAPQVKMSIYDGPPAGKEDVNLSFRNLLVLDCRAGLTPNALGPLLSHFSAGRPPA